VEAEVGEATDIMATIMGVMVTATAGAIIIRIHAVTKPQGPSRFDAAGVVLCRVWTGGVFRKVRFLALRARPAIAGQPQLIGDANSSGAAG
jgi:hypothetical protein